MEAYDLGDPSRVSSSNATVTINVQRNRAPVFVQTSYTFEMNEVATVNPQTVVGQVLANDPDNGVSIDKILTKQWSLFELRLLVML